MALLLLTTRAGAVEQVWQEVIQAQAGAVGLAVKMPARQYQVDSLALRATLQRVTEISGPGAQRTIRLPMPDGSLADFEIYESPVMEAALAQRFPEIKTYKVYGIDDPLASGRLDITPQGFHAMLHTSQGRVFIDPQAGSQWLDHYQARSRSTSQSPGYTCGVDDHALSMTPVSRSVARAAERIRGSILEYRLAVAATAEYVASVFNASRKGSAVDQAQAAIVTAINRVNVIYERDLGIRLVLVANNDRLIENGGNVVFSNGNGSRMFIENQAWIDLKIGRSNYDIGHVFGTGSGGLAFRGSACDLRNKAKGVSGIFNPLGDPFYIDFVAHEIGHQLNAEHSFNGTTRSCSSGRIRSSPFEPGSGSTIMAYAGICGVENLQLNSDATFHAGSIAQIDSFTMAGGSCYDRVAATPANPNYPRVSVPANPIIPANTAFVLDGTASDADAGQTLSYQWDQMDAGCPTDARSYGTDTGYNALFRSYLPRNVSTRHFPAVGTQVQGLYDDAEVVPCNTRKVNLRLTARDGLSGVGSANVRVSVKNTGAAFEILNIAAPNPIVDGTPFEVTWRVAGTDQPPINCANVDIDLMTFADDPKTDDPYYSYSVHPLLLAPTPNDGSESVSIPAEKSHPRARIRVKCSDNIFYDISNADLVIDGTDPDPVTGNFSDTETLVFFNNKGTTGAVAPACGAVIQCDNSPESVGDGGGGSRGSGAVGYQWLVLLTGMLLLSGIRRREGD